MNGYYREKKSAKELRRAGYASLRGYWGVAILAMLLALVLGASLSGGAFNFNYSGGLSVNTDSLPIDLSGLFSEEETTLTPEEMEDLLPSGEELRDLVDQLLSDEALALFGIGLLAIFVGASLFSIALRLFVGAPMGVGHHRVRLKILDREETKVSEVFSGFRRCYWGSVLMRLLRAVYLFLWRLPATVMFTAFFGSVVVLALRALAEEGILEDAIAVPGFEIPWIVSLLALCFAIGFAFLPIVAEHRYAMADFILAENPGCTATDALRQSAIMMKGNKWRLFCLRLSFLGWILLGALTGGLLYIWMNPYLYQTEAAFYHEISGREAIRSTLFDMKDFMEGL